MPAATRNSQADGRGGFRGKPKADIAALTEAAVRFGDAFMAMPDVDEFEVNPLMVMPEGKGVVAVDSLVSSKRC